MQGNGARRLGANKQPVRMTASPRQDHVTMAAEPPQSPVTKQSAAWRCAGSSRPAGDRGDPMVQPIPGNDRVTPGHVPAGSVAARAVGEGPRGRGTGGEGLPRQPGDPPGARPRSRTPESLAEVVLSLQPAPPGQRRSGRLAAGPQEAANQPVLTGQRAGRGTRPGARRRAAVRSGIHRVVHLGLEIGPIIG